jgi:hypothetical protein
MGVSCAGWREHKELLVRARKAERSTRFSVAHCTEHAAWERSSRASSESMSGEEASALAQVRLRLPWLPIPTRKPCSSWMMCMVCFLFHQNSCW